VARMAGMPPELVERAKEILKGLEDKGIGADRLQQIKGITAPKMQLSIFDSHSETFKEIRTMLENFDINRLTPVEALLKLNEIKNLLQ
jgi:DNA mismatch repair protein MutS